MRYGILAGLFLGILTGTYFVSDKQTIALQLPESYQKGNRKCQKKKPYKPYIAKSIKPW